MNRLLAVGALALLAAIAASAPAGARSSHRHHAAPGPTAVGRPGQLQYVLIDDHDPRRLERAARTARDLAAAHQVKEFRIVLLGPAVLLAIPGSNIVQKEVEGIVRRYPAIHLVVCREVVDALAKAAHRRPPLLPGTQVLTCNGLGGLMNKGGWEPVPGL
ncbi:MAG TPA: hypothetical protein VHD15_07765 [Hyphomicrobiales bacterium]|nr:hypothetical protein [Hyphomicrobiales bacterium]